MREMFSVLVHAVLLCLVSSISATLAFAEDRVALVVGNSDYQSVGSLENPKNDADDIGAALSRLGFEVTTSFDLDSRSMNLALRDFSRSARNAEMAVIYFAGHGMEIDRRNYLIPVDAILEQASDVTFEAIEMQKFLSAVRGANMLRLVLLDACRDNPFLRQIEVASTRSLGRGLGSVEPASGVLVGYSAKGGTVALDGDGRNSPYAAALLAHLETPGLEIGQLFRRVRDTVLKETSGQQEPFTYGSLPAHDIYFSTPKPKGPSATEVFQGFLSADAVNTTSSWRDFINQYENVESGAEVVERARQRLAALKAPKEAVRPDVGATPSVAPQQFLSPLIRACDQLAADPDDPERPPDALGVTIGDIDANAAATACTLASSGHPESARSRYQLSRALESAGRENEALKQLLKAAESGYPAALASLGAALIENPVGSYDVQKAVNLLEAAIEAGNTVAARHLGDFFNLPASQSILVGRNPLDYYSIAAAAGDPTAMYEAGYRLVSSRLSSKEEKLQGVSWLSAAAEAGIKDAASRLANFLLSSSTPTEMRDVDRAVLLLSALVESGDADTAQLLARRYRRGNGLSANMVEAVRWAGVSAELGNPLGMVETGYNFELGLGRLNIDPVSAAQNYFDALSAGARHPYLRHPEDWPRDVARALQRLLSGSTRARYRGPIDGLVGPGTRDAMKRLCGCSESNATTEFGWLFRSGRGSGD